jgi:hypothetical protein
MITLFKGLKDAHAAEMISAGTYRGLEAELIVLWLGV